MRAHTFSDEDVSTNGGAGESEAPEYVFEGFHIEFSGKVMLTPLVPRDTVGGGPNVSGSSSLIGSARALRTYLKTNRS